MHTRTDRRCHERRLGRGGFALLLGLLAVLASCSDDSLGELGGRSSEWIGEVATTTATTTTTVPIVTHSVREVEWINDEFGTPDSQLERDRVLAAVFARSGDSSQYLQASREEMAAIVPEVQFPSVVPVEVTHITSQVVIESRELELADDPTAAFGLWSVEPYTRSRSVGQTAVLQVSRDPDGVGLAEGDDPEAVCTALVTGNRVCSAESLTDRPVWRLEGGTRVVHIWYSDPFRYELDGFRGFGEGLVHEVIDSVVPLTELLPEE